jgi:hypothetical protein
VAASTLRAVASTRVVHRRAALAIAVVAVSLTSAVLGLQSGGEADSSRLAVPTTGFGPVYDRAVARMTHVNHQLEDRQAELFYALHRPAGPVEVRRLRVQVVALEREYRDALAAMREAAR